MILFVGETLLRDQAEFKRYRDKRHELGLFYGECWASRETERLLGVFLFGADDPKLSRYPILMLSEGTIDLNHRL